MSKLEKIKFIYADPDRAMKDGAIPLDTYGTQLDLKLHNIKLEEGKRYWFWRDDGDIQGNDDPLLFSGLIHLDRKSGKWILEVDPNSWKHYSESEFKKGYTIEEIIGSKKNAR